MQEIKIDGEYIKLDQLLKLSNIAQSGGEAKFLVLEDEVFVNDILIKQRGKKVKPGDKVRYKNIEIRVV